MADSEVVKEKEEYPPQAELQGSRPSHFDWPPPVQLAAAVATALAAVLLLTGHEQAALAAILLALILQGVSLYQLKTFRDDYVRQQRENAAAATRR